MPTCWSGTPFFRGLLLSANDFVLVWTFLRVGERAGISWWPRWLIFECDSSKTTSKIVPSEKFSPNLTESRHRIRLSLFQNFLLQIPLYVDFSILIPLCSMIMSIHCFIGIFVGPLNTNCIKYQSNQKWAKLELSLSGGKSTTLCILCHEKMRRAAVHMYHSTLMCSSQDYLVKTPIVNNRGGG